MHETATRSIIENVGSERAVSAPVVATLIHEYPGIPQVTS